MIYELNREQIAAGENQLEIEINIDGADTGSWFTAPVTEGFLIFGFALLLAGKFDQGCTDNPAILQPCGDVLEIPRNKCSLKEILN